MKKSFVYLIGSLTNKKLITYVGWSHDVVKRIKNHNLGKGAKFTKGRQWFLIYKKSFLNKKNAMKEIHHLYCFISVPQHHNLLKPTTSN